jgi:hypothetical protein
LYLAYREACAFNELHTGHQLWLNAPDGRSFVLFPTKQHWKFPSRLSWIREGLARLALDVQANHVPARAIPALGCGCGELDFRAVLSLVCDVFAPLPQVEVDVYAPI